MDPALKEITVTFDQDMEEGMSWTGGGPEFPQIPEGQKGTLARQAHVRAAGEAPKRTPLPGRHQFPQLPELPQRRGCARPDLGHLVHHLGHQRHPETRNPSAEDRQREAAIGAQDVSPDLKELRVTFNVPMGGGFSWTGGGPEFPTIPEGKKPFWTEDHKTCVLPVELKPNSQYRLGLNSPSYKNFKSAEGVPLAPVVYTFKTGAK